jgi:Methylase involved in ubiquinone/menaquinone biosynthesis
LAGSWGGTGRFPHALGMRVGIDPAENPLPLARQGGITVVQGVGESLPFRNASFGAVLFVVTLCFVQEPLAVLREAHRVLRDEGMLVLGMVFADSPWGEFYRQKGAMGHPFYKAARFLTRTQTASFLAQAGFRLVAAQSTLRQPPNEKGLRCESPMEGDLPDAGFVAWKAVKA